MTGRIVQADHSFFGQSGAPEFQVALLSTVRDVALLRHGKWTLYANEAQFGYLPLQLRKTVADRSMGGPQQPPADVRWIHKP
jgi:hypothetical protein